VERAGDSDMLECLRIEIQERHSAVERAERDRQALDDIAGILEACDRDTVAQICVVVRATGRSVD
jgi:hypothetical protein